VILGLAALGFWKPRALVWPFALIGVWVGLSFLAEALGLVRKRKHDVHRAHRPIVLAVLPSVHCLARRATRHRTR
jgi:hypothetical protein